MDYFRKILTRIFLTIVFSSITMIPTMTLAVDWDLSTVFQPGNFHVKNLRTFAQKAKEVTGGELVITVHDSGSLGMKGPETMAGVRDHIVDAAETSLEWQVGEARMAGLGAMPGLALGYKETKILADVMRPYLNKVFERYNQKLLYMVPWQGQGLYSKKPVNLVADLKGLKMRAASEMAVRLFDQMGASPIQLPWPEVVPALATGMINGVTTSSMSGVDGKFWEFLGYHSRFDWANPLSIVTVNLDAWKKLAPGHQQAIEKLAGELEPEFWKISESLNNENLALLGKNGMKINVPDPKLRKEILAAGERVWSNYLKTAGPEANAIVKEFLDKAGR